MWNKTKELEKFLLDEFVSGKYVSGEKIPSRNQLAIRHNCSRTIVEKVVSKLTAQGYLRSVKGSGTVFVSANPTPEEIKEIRVISYYDVRSSDPTYFFLGEVLTHEPILWFQPQYINRDIDRLVEPNGIIIWLMPAYEHIYYLNYIKAHNVPLLLINRNYQGFDYIRTESYSSIHEGLSWLLIEGGREIAFVSREPSTVVPYLHDRIIAFYQSCIDLGASLPTKWNLIRKFVDKPEEISEVGRRLFGGYKKPKAIFVMNEDLVVPLMICAKNYNLQPGKDFKLLTFDYIPELANYPGVGMLRQPYIMFQSEVQNYLNLRKAGNNNSFTVSLKTDLII